MLSRVWNRLRRLGSPAERARRELLAIQLTAADTAIDCGANVGDITEHLCRSGATVYAFEPNPFAFKVLSHRFADKENVHCFPHGVFDRNDVKRLYFHEHSDANELLWSTGSSLLESKPNVLKDKHLDTKVIDLTEFVASLGSRVKLLKMDVEGVEGPILKKLIATGIIRRIDHVFVETHERKTPELKAEIDEVRQLLKALKLAHVNLNWT